MAIPPGPMSLDLSKRKEVTQDQKRFVTRSGLSPQLPDHRAPSFGYLQILTRSKRQLLEKTTFTLDYISYKSYLKSAINQSPLITLANAQAVIKILFASSNYTYTSFVEVDFFYSYCVF